MDTTEVKQHENGIRSASSLIKTYESEFRLNQLQQLLALYEENRSNLIQCLQRDYNTTFDIQDVTSLIQEVRATIEKIQEWTGTKRMSGLLSMNVVTLKKESVGSVLIVSDPHYPLHLSLLAFPAAICAGNVVVIKAPDGTPLFTRAITQLLPKYLDPEIYRVIPGDSDVDTVLGGHFDRIVVMGKAGIIRKVYAAAQKELTPVTAVTNGKNPVYIDDSIDIEVAAIHIIEAKLSSFSRPCVGPDYILCNQVVQEHLISTVVKMSGQIANKFWPISSKENFDRLKYLLQTTKGRILLGGHIDEQGQRISLTIVADVAKDDPLFQEEFLGPILPIVEVKTVYDVISLTRRTRDRANSGKWTDYKMAANVLYAFTTRRIAQVRLMQGTLAANIVFNSTNIQNDVSNYFLCGESAYKLFTKTKVANRLPLKHVSEPSDKSSVHEESCTNSNYFGTKQVLDSTIPHRLKIIAVSIFALFIAHFLGWQ